MTNFFVVVADVYWSSLDIQAYTSTACNTIFPNAILLHSSILLCYMSVGTLSSPVNIMKDLLTGHPSTRGTGIVLIMGHTETL